MKHLVFVSTTLFCLAFVSCKKTSTLFQRLDSDYTGIAFHNTIVEGDTLNILNTEFIYNGGGVAIGDLNGDGLQDLFFTGNQSDNRCYLNKGKLQFEDITEKANLAKPNKAIWSAGIMILDLNADGKQDIYICNTFQKAAVLRRNLLYINQGNDAAGVPQFVEKAAEYGLANEGHTPNGQFFDYDNDGDLDLFLSVNVMDRPNPNSFRLKKTDGSDPNTDRLLRNDWSDSLGHAVFTDVSLAAGIVHDGYSHSALVTDFDRDGWLDIYVANDYVTNDLIYINNRNGTFSNRIADMFKHQAGSAMGSDIADVNNDGQLDIFTTEMLPYYNKRKKLFQGPNNYAVYKFNTEYGYEHQYGRNVLQLNQGINSTTGLPVFSDVSLMSNTQETEWSWTPLLADFDNDGDRDLFVTNGFPRDVTDHDFGAYYAGNKGLIAPMDLQDMIPEIKVPKFAFRNEGNLQFTDQSKAWGVDIHAFTNGAAYADLDNDGDLDLVANNINDKAFVFKNTLNDAKERPNHFLRVQVSGAQPGSTAFGATVTAYFNGQKQIAQVLSARGFSAASESVVHFGLGNAVQADSVVVQWPGLRAHTLQLVKADQTIVVLPPAAPNLSAFVAGKGWFAQRSPLELGLQNDQMEDDFIDFDYQRTLPHKFSEYGPSLAVGDVDGDGLDDIYQAGTSGTDGVFFLQKKDGTFIQKTLKTKVNRFKLEEDAGCLLFDADSDGDLDLLAVRGGAQNPPQSPMYQDMLFVNDGKGNFASDSLALPPDATNGMVARAADYDGDGDLDLFIGGNVQTRAYPMADPSRILRNDTQRGGPARFTDATAQVCPALAQMGIVQDALWTDFDGDNRPDLVIASLWSPLVFLKNTGNTFQDMTNGTGMADQVGWWTSLTAADFDHDGDMDYVAGNYGQNLYFQCHTNEPLSVYAKDFDSNGSLDAFIACHWRDSVGDKHEYFYHTRDDMVRQLLLIRRKFYGYGDFGAATVQQVFTPQELEGATIKRVHQMASCYIENLGNGQFKQTPLPWQAQLAPLFGMLPHDADNDGDLDLLLTGNDYGMELLQGRADAFHGLVLRNDNGAPTVPVSLEQSHFYAPDNSRALVQMSRANGDQLLLVSQHKKGIRVLQTQQKAVNMVKVQPNETKIRLRFPDGRTRVHEFYYGHGFMAQQQRMLLVPAGAEVVR
jgi:enediyne biosynthesis protein E4